MKLEHEYMNTYAKFNQIFLEFKRFCKFHFNGHATLETLFLINIEPVEMSLRFIFQELILTSDG